MRQASWNEVFTPRVRDRLVIVPEVPQEPRGWRRLFWWEDLVTFALLGIVLLAVVGSVERAHWVDDMPSLYPITFFGLALGAALARLRWPEAAVHLLALPAGAAGVLGQLLALVPGPTPWDRYDALHDRLGQWFSAAFGGGISNDSLPFIILVVSASWVAAYLSSWAVFRWQNVWLAPIPGGALLLANVSNLPGQFSFAFVVFLIGAALLVTRLYVMERAKAWRERGTPYPPLLSLSVLHVTFWLALVLVGLAWLMPQANEADAIESLWRRAAAPVTERVEGLGRLFVSVEPKKPVRVHRFEDILPFLGGVELSDRAVVEVLAPGLEQPRYLRAQSYYFYTPTGWKQGVSQASSLGAGQVAPANQGAGLREDVTVQVISRAGAGDSILTVGQPQRVDRPTRYEWWHTRQDVTGIEAEDGLASGARYESTGSISAATEDDLRAAGTGYPGWVTDRYLQLPGELPARVGELARRLAAPESNPYDRALAIESHLRTIPYDLDVPDAPHGRDAIDYFLFDVRRGYFDYHASAMVVLLRSVGIPSRLAVGYVLQATGSERETYRHQVTELDAFAWPEVYFPGLGWVEFNPTPSLPRVARPGPAVVVDTEPSEGLLPPAGLGLEDLGQLLPEAGGAPEAGLPRPGTGGHTSTVLLAFAAAVGVAAMLAVAASGYAWRRGLAGLSPPARLWEQTVRLGSWTRLPPAPGETPHEYARRLRSELGGPADIELLADAYVGHRFGRQPAAAWEEARLEGAWRAARAGLLRRLWPWRSA